VPHSLDGSRGGVATNFFHPDHNRRGASLVGGFSPPSAPPNPPPPPPTGDIYLLLKYHHRHRTPSSLPRTRPGIPDLPPYREKKLTMIRLHHHSAVPSALADMALPSPEVVAPIRVAVGMALINNRDVTMLPAQPLAPRRRPPASDTLTTTTALHRLSPMSLPRPLVNLSSPPSQLVVCTAFL
jgi:hypothetical protein